MINLRNVYTNDPHSLSFLRQPIQDRGVQIYGFVPSHKTSYEDLKRQIKSYQLSDLLHRSFLAHAQIREVKLGGSDDQSAHPAMPTILIWILERLAYHAIMLGDDDIVDKENLTEDKWQRLVSSVANYTFSGAGSSLLVPRQQRINTSLYRDASHQALLNLDLQQSVGRSLALASNPYNYKQTAWKTWETQCGVSVEAYLQACMTYLIWVEYFNFPVHGELKLDRSALYEWVQKLKHYSPEILNILNKLYVANPDVLRRLGVQQLQKGHESHAWNPLLTFPVVNIEHLGILITPIPQLLINRMSPQGLYFAGLYQCQRPHKAAFTNELGLYLKSTLNASYHC